MHRDGFNSSKQRFRRVEMLAVTVFVRYRALDGGSTHKRVIRRTSPRLCGGARLGVRF